MKLLLLNLLSLLSFAVFAQNQPNVFSYQFEARKGFGVDAGEQVQKDLKSAGANYNDSLIAAMKNYIEKRNLKSGTVYLAQDNMPCVVPNTNLMTPMPNAWQKRKDSSLKKQPGAIPNPARPRLKPFVIPINHPAGN